MSNERDKALALQVVREIDAAFEKSERLRLGRWVLPDERETTIASFIATALTTARKEARAEAFKEAVQIVGHLTCPAEFEGNWRNGYSHAQNDAFRAIEAATMTQKGTDDAERR